jgi:glucokinase
VRILAGDIGGTKTHFAIVERGPAGLRILFERVVSSREIKTFPDAVQAILHEARLDVGGASFGVPGPVIGRRVQGTNLPWPVDGDQIAARFGLGRVVVLNDFAAQAIGIRELAQEELVPLNPHAAPPDPTGPVAVIGAGTGLGEAYLVRVGGRPHAFGTEGGHADFAARNEEEIGLQRFLAARFGHVSTERVVSGEGLANIYAYLRAVGRHREDPGVAAALAAASDPAPEISRAAIESRDPLASAALDMFISIYGAEAGNMALRLLARGGVFVTGGIAVKILPRLRAGGFLEAFRDKGRLGDFVGTLPIHVVTNQRTGLLGAAAAGLPSQEGW